MVCSRFCLVNTIEAGKNILLAVDAASLISPGMSQPPRT